MSLLPNMPHSGGQAGGQATDQRPLSYEGSGERVLLKQTQQPQQLALAITGPSAALALAATLTAAYGLWVISDPAGKVEVLNDVAREVTSILEKAAKFAKKQAPSLETVRGAIKQAFETVAASPWTLKSNIEQFARDLIGSPTATGTPAQNRPVPIPTTPSAPAIPVPRTVSGVPAMPVMPINPPTTAIPAPLEAGQPTLEQIEAQIALESAAQDLSFETSRVFDHFAYKPASIEQFESDVSSLRTAVKTYDSALEHAKNLNTGYQSVEASVENVYTQANELLNRAKTRLDQITAPAAPSAPTQSQSATVADASGYLTQEGMFSPSAVAGAMPVSVVDQFSASPAKLVHVWVNLDTGAVSEIAQQGERWISATIGVMSSSKDAGDSVEIVPQGKGWLGERSTAIKERFINAFFNPPPSNEPPGGGKKPNWKFWGFIALLAAPSLIALRGQHIQEKQFGESTKNQKEYAKETNDRLDDQAAAAEKARQEEKKRAAGTGIEIRPPDLPPLIDLKTLEARGASLIDFWSQLLAAGRNKIRQNTEDPAVLASFDSSSTVLITNLENQLRALQSEPTDQGRLTILSAMAGQGLSVGGDPKNPQDGKILTVVINLINQHAAVTAKTVTTLPMPQPQTPLGPPAPATSGTPPAREPRAQPAIPPIPTPDTPPSEAEYPVTAPPPQPEPTIPPMPEPNFSRPAITLPPPKTNGNPDAGEYPKTAPPPASVDDLPDLDDSNARPEPEVVPGPGTTKPLQQPGATNGSSETAGPEPTGSDKPAGSDKPVEPAEPVEPAPSK